jgi:hypothetical protein
MTRTVLSFLILSFLCFQAAYAIDPGRAQGTLKINDETIELKEAYAQFHDNAEGLLDRPKEIRIVLADRKVPQESLRGIAFLPVTTLAKEGKVRGLLLQFDPSDQSKMVVTVLRQPSRQGTSLTTLSRGDSEKKLFRNLVISKTRVSGETEYTEKRVAGSDEIPTISYSAKFSAPLFNELPVTADLKGKAAQDSPQAKVLKEKINALKKGDFNAVKRLSTERSNARTDLLLTQMGGDQAKMFAQEAARDMEDSFKSIKRVVVRGSTAVMIFSSNQWSVFAQEGGQWKSDN